jgi:hypothetical protein
MGVYNNLISFDQHVAQNSLEAIRPDLATTWSWNEDGTELTFTLRQDVSWHDGTPFTAKDVLCTVDVMLDKAKEKEKVRFNPRKSFYKNLASVSANDDYEVTFHLKGHSQLSRCCSRPASRRLPLAIRRPIKCGSSRSALGRSNSSNSSPMRWSEPREIPIIGSLDGLISTASSGTSCRIARPET